MAESTKAAELSSLTVPDLKVLLKQYGESCSGNKGELVARLQPFVQEDEGHSKFMRKGNATWSITTRALSTAAASGKVGGGKPGRRQVKEHATRDAAQKYADKQIKDKKKDGYATADEDDDDEEEDDDDDDDDDDTAAGAPPAKKARTVAAASGDVDPASGLAGTGVVHKDAKGVLFDCELNLLDLAKNHDKFYNIQVIKVGDDYYCFTHWGRTGAKGQSQTEGPETEANAISTFKTKFHDKTGNDWDDRANFKVKKNKYSLLKIDYASKAPSGHWEFYEAPNWKPYVQEATDILEVVFKHFQANTHLGVRVVKSGMYSYSVDLHKMTQTNIEHPAHTVRAIRRVVP